MDITELSPEQKWEVIPAGMINKLVSSLSDQAAKLVIKGLRYRTATRG